MSEMLKVFFDNKTDKFRQIYEKPNLIDRMFRKSVLARFQQTFLECCAMGYKSALDIGCGSGVLALRLAEAGMDVVGIDFSGEMIKTAARVCAGKNIKGRLELKHTDLMDFNPGHKFDAVIALGFFDYIPDPGACLRQMVCLACKEVIVSFPAYEDILSVQRKIRYRFFKKCPVYFYKKEEIERFAAQSGFSDFNLRRLSRDYLLQGYLK